MKTLLLILSIMSIQVWARPEVAISESVEISQKPLLRLSDVVTVREGTEELNSFLDGIILREDSRDLVLSGKIFSGEILSKTREALRANDSIRKLNPSFKIPSEVNVRFSTTTISRAEVTRKVTNILQSRCNHCDFKISVQTTPIPNSKNWDLDFSQISAKGSFLIPVRESESNQNKWISGSARISQLTPVTTRLITQGERVQSEDVRLEMIDTTYAKDGVLRLADIQGQVATRALSVGSAVWSSDLRREPAAKRGQVVRAILGDSSFEITVNMVAEDNGYIGDLIKVKNLENQKILSGQIIEKGVVKLQ